MRVSVVINPKAGSINTNMLEEKIRDALFRCDLHIHYAGQNGSTEDFIRHEISKNTNVIAVCGGDGTVNATLQMLMKNRHLVDELPPLCLICTGTANDLAHEIGISKKVDAAARLILEGTEKKIDIIEVTANDEKKYMLTNGGIGIPAMTADKSNRLRSTLMSLASDLRSSPIKRKLFKLSYKLVKKMGPMIYSTVLLDSLREWDPKGWQLEIELPKKKINTMAPFILINNQPALGGSFMTAPFTSNNDGNVNLLVIETKNTIDHLEKIVQVYTGSLNEGPQVHSYEVPDLMIRSKSKKRKITYFGDGEIIFRDVDAVRVRCLRKSLKVMVQE